MRTEIIAEVGNSHNGDLRRALKLIRVAQDCRVDAVKFQCYTPDELVDLRGDGPAPEPWGSQGWSMHKLYTKAQTPHHWFPVLAEYCNSIGMPWFSSVFGPESLNMLEAVGCPRYKIAALDYGKDELFGLVEATGKPVVQSVRAPFGGWADARLYCPPGYPQTDTELSYLHDAHAFDGFSYHGTDPRVPVWAVAAGARMVEFHFHLKDEPNELEAAVCLDEAQTAWMVKEIRELEACL